MKCMVAPWRHVGMHFFLIWGVWPTLSGIRINQVLSSLISVATSEHAGKLQLCWEASTNPSFHVLLS